MKKGFISNLQFYSTKDGPGIRTTVFCSGCNLKCAWCANPELISGKRNFFHYKQRCIHCGSCVNIASHAITFANQGCLIDRSQSFDWNEVADICPKDAYEIKGTFIDPQTLTDKLLRDKDFYDESMGGVTFSGGEPALQPDFIIECAKLLHQNNIHVALDTAGCIEWSTLKNIIEEIDLVLFDIKAFDSVIHKECTQRDNKLILNNIKNISNMKKDIWIRLVIVPGWNDDLTDIRKRLQFIRSLGSFVKRVDVLKYHNLGASKYEQLGQNYSIHPNTICSKRLLSSIKKIAEEEKIKIHIEN